METLTQVIEKKDTFSYLLELIPTIPEQYKDRIQSARRLWNSLSIERQRQIYYDIECRLKRGEKINPNPFFLIDDCHPTPINYNGSSGLNDMIKTEKMVCAKYYEKYGIYTLKEAKIFEM